MTKLTKTHIKERDEIATRLRDKREVLEKAIEEFNESMAKAWEHVETDLEAYNEAVSEANEWRDGIVTEISDYVDNRSEKWQESDKAQTVEAWKGEYENEFEPVEIEKPEDMEADLGDDIADLIEQLPEECD